MYQKKRFTDITSPLENFLGAEFVALGEIRWRRSLKDPAEEWFEGEIPTKIVSLLL